MTLEIADYSWIPVERSRRVQEYIHWKIYMDQYKVNWWIRDIRPELHLKYELRALWEGRITEMHGWEDVLSSALDGLKDWISSALETFWNNIISPGVSAIFNTFKSIWNAAKEWAMQAYSSAYAAYSTVTSVMGYVLTIYNKVFGDIWQTLISVSSNISNLVQNFINKVQSALTVVWDYMSAFFSSYIKPFIEKEFSFYKSLWDITKYYSQQALQMTHNIANQLGGMWDSITTTVSGAFESVTHALSSLGESIQAGFRSAISYIYDILNGIWNDVIVPLGEQIKDGIQVALDTLGNVIGNTLMSIWNFILGLGRGSPDVAEANAFFVLKVITLASLGLGGATLAGELLHPLKSLGLGRFAAMIYKATNYDLISGMIVGALARAAIGQGARYAFNYQFRPFLPSWHDLMELYSRGVLSESEMRKYAGYYGYADEHIAYFNELKNTPLRYFALEAVARTGYWDESWYREEVQRAGYAKKSQDVMMLMLRDTSYMIVRRVYEPVLKKRYQVGAISRSELRQELTTLGYDERVRDMLTNTLTLTRDTEMISDMIDAVRHAYRQGIISAETFRTQLAKIGIDSEMINRYLMIEQLYSGVGIYQTQKEEVRTMSKTIAIKRYKEGLTTSDELDNELRMLGYSAEQRRLIKVFADLERDYEYALEIKKALVGALKKGYITVQTFIEKMREFGFTDDRIYLELQINALLGYISPEGMTE